MDFEIFSQKIIDFTKEPMFFGQGRNLQRYDVYKYPIFDKLCEKHISQFWLPTEVSLIKDRADFKLLKPHEEFIFTSNLKYQTLLDSVQSRSPALTLMNYVSIPELEELFLTWTFFEMLHSRSYTYILREIYPNPTVIINEIMKTQTILDRAKSVTNKYNEFLNKILSGKDEKELRKSLFLSLITTNILEGVRFYVSFACSFAFAENGIMEGNAKIIKLIAKDENIHLSMSQRLINILKTDKSEGFVEIAKECENEVYELYKQANIEEENWIEYLFKDGSIFGLNETILKKYMKVLINKRMLAIGYEPFSSETSEDHIIPWMKSWLSTKDVQIALQETENESYNKGSYVNDL